MLRYWIYRYDEERGGYRRAGGGYTTNREQALRYVEGGGDRAILCYDYPANTPGFIPSEKLANGSIIEDVQHVRPGRPVEREGSYRRITLEIREDLLARIDASGVSRREFIERLLVEK